MTHAEKEERNALIVAQRQAGRAMADIAADFGVSESLVYTACKKAGVAHFKIKPRTHGTPRYGKDHAAFKSDEKAAAFIEERNPGFEYAGNYTGTDGRADVKCKTCGYIFSICGVSIRHGTVRCPECRKAKSEKKRKEIAEAKEEARQQKAKEREEKREAKAAEKEAARVIYKRVCVECGHEFETNNSRMICCSPECSRHRQNRHADRRLKAHGQKENGITLRRLYNRDGGVCYICGKSCDMNDKSERDGTIICGDNYPSIDHVVPLAKGGANEWSNVRLACRRCNYMKSDKL